MEIKFWALTATHAADVLSPARSQRVQLATDAAGALNWYLVSPGDTNGAVLCELLCPAAAIVQATERIARVLNRARP